MGLFTIELNVPRALKIRTLFFMNQMQILSFGRFIIRSILTELEIHMEPNRFQYILVSQEQHAVKNKLSLERFKISLLLDKKIGPQ